MARNHIHDRPVKGNNGVSLTIIVAKRGDLLLCGNMGYEILKISPIPVLFDRAVASTCIWVYARTFYKYIFLDCRLISPLPFLPHDLPYLQKCGFCTFLKISPCKMSNVFDKPPYISNPREISLSLPLSLSLPSPSLSLLPWREIISHKVSLLWSTRTHCYDIANKNLSKIEWSKQDLIFA